MTRKQLKNALRMASRKGKRPRRVAKKVARTIAVARILAFQIASLRSMFLQRFAGQRIRPDTIPAMKAALPDWYYSLTGLPIISVTRSETDPNVLEVEYMREAPHD